MSVALAKTAAWCTVAAIADNIPLNLRDFLLDPGSTTQRMQSEYAAEINVALLKQQWQEPHYQEAQLLNIPLHQQALIRETYLESQHKIWMYARVVFRRDLFSGETQHLLQELDKRPIGKILFRDPTMRRSPFEIALLEPQHLEYQYATQQRSAPAKLWARRSIFWLQEKPLLLMEVFFPEFDELIKKCKSSY